MPQIENTSSSHSYKGQSHVLSINKVLNSQIILQYNLSTSLLLFQIKFVKRAFPPPLMIGNDCFSEA